MAISTRSFFFFYLSIVIFSLQFSLISTHVRNDEENEEEKEEFYLFPYQENFCPKNLNTKDGQLSDKLVVCNGGGSVASDIRIEFFFKTKNATILSISSSLPICNSSTTNVSCSLSSLAPGQCLTIANKVIYQCNQTNCSVKIKGELSATRPEMLSRYFEDYSRRSKCKGLKVVHGGLQGAPTPVPFDKVRIALDSYPNTNCNVGAPNNCQSCCKNVDSPSVHINSPFSPSSSEVLFDFYISEPVEVNNLGGSMKFIYKFYIKAIGDAPPLSLLEFSDYNIFSISYDPAKILLKSGEYINLSPSNTSIYFLNNDFTSSIGNGFDVKIFNPFVLPEQSLNFTFSFEYDLLIFHTEQNISNVYSVQPQLCLTAYQYNQAAYIYHIPFQVLDNCSVSDSFCVQSQSNCISTNQPIVIENIPFGDCVKCNEYISSLMQPTQNIAYDLVSNKTIFDGAYTIDYEHNGSLQHDILVPNYYAQTMAQYNQDCQCDHFVDGSQFDTLRLLPGVTCVNKGITGSVSFDAQGKSTSIFIVKPLIGTDNSNYKEIQLSDGMTLLNGALAGNIFWLDWEGLTGLNDAILYQTYGNIISNDFSFINLHVNHTGSVVVDALEIFNANVALYSKKCFSG